jgi:hypothetical protein
MSFAADERFHDGSRHWIGKDRGGVKFVNVRTARCAGASRLKRLPKTSLIKEYAADVASKATVCRRHDQPYEQADARPRISWSLRSAPIHF